MTIQDIPFPILSLCKKHFKANEIEIADIQGIVCTHHNIVYERVLTKTRKKEVVTVRHISMYLSRIFINDSLETIGKHFNRKHDNLVHATKKVLGFMNIDEEYTESVLCLVQKIVSAILNKKTKTPV